MGLNQMEKYIEQLNKKGFDVIRLAHGLVIRNKDLTIIGKADNTLWTSQDILCAECYGFSASEDYIVFDVGLNIGVAALYFAQKPWVKYIYGFEPFSATFKQALVNFTNNPKLSSKITPFNFGLGAKDTRLSIHYNQDLPGSMSTVVDRYKEGGNLESVEIKNITTVIQPILAKHNEKVLFKIDCEGAEKEILPALESSGLLKKIDVILLEWHFEPPTFLVDILTRNNFTVFFSHVVLNELGFIQAVRA